MNTLLASYFSAIGCYLALAKASFRKFFIYRHAVIVNLISSVFYGLLRFSVIAAMFAGQQYVGGYDITSASTANWLAQSMIGFTLMWNPFDLSKQIQTGDVVIIIIRPRNLQLTYFVESFGQAGYGMLTRFLLTATLAVVVFPFRLPQSYPTWFFFVLSLLLAIGVNTSIRFLFEVSAFWLLNADGISYMIASLSVICSGIVIPLHFFPSGISDLMWFTPFPGQIQNPIDIFLERGSVLFLLGHQIGWLIALLVIGRYTLAVAERKLVVHGG